jgi:hypothetical protein
VATNIESILLAAYAAMETLAGTIDPAVPFARHRLREVNLDALPIPDRIRAFLVTVGSATKDETWSSRSRRWFRGELRIQVGYVSPRESARDPDLQALGYEGMADTDLPLIINKILYSAFLALTDIKSPEYLRSDPIIGTSRMHVFGLEWAESV